jgi:hypothetical protein
MLDEKMQYLSPEAHGRKKMLTGEIVPCDSMSFPTNEISSVSHIF